MGGQGQRGAWATSTSAAITKANVFCWDRRKGLNKLSNMGYWVIGHIGFISALVGSPIAKA